MFYRNDVASLDVGQLLAILTIVGNKPDKITFINQRPTSKLSPPSRV